MVEIFEELAALRRNRQEGVLVTVVDCKGHSPAAPGKKMLCRKDGTCDGTIGGGELEQAAVKLAVSIMAGTEKTYRLLKYNLSGDSRVGADADINMICGGTATLFFEHIRVSPKVYIFGGGHIGLALTEWLPRLDMDVINVSDHELSIDNEQEIARILTKEPDIDGGYMVLASYSHEADYAVLREIYKQRRRPKYLGMVASAAKVKAFIVRLEQELEREIDREMLYTPIGLDLGGANPQDIALSIAAEIQAVRYGKTGHRHLRKAGC